MRLTLALAFAMSAMSSPSAAQLVDNRSNWGLTLGVDWLTGSFNPDRGLIAGQPYAYSARAYGARLNLGVIFLKHILIGGDAGAVFFPGDRTFNEGQGDEYKATTTNSMVSSLNVGLISTPIGRTTRVGRKLWFGALAGKAKWAGERRFDFEHCFGCVIHKIHMRSGPYVEPFVVFGGGDRDGGGGFKFAYRKYLASYAAVRDEMTFGLYFDFLKL